MSVRGFNTGTGVERYDYNALDNVPLTTNTRVKGDAEVEYREGDVNLTKANIGLGNVDNTSDANKPVSTAQQNALNGKVDKVTGKGLSTNDYTNEDKQKLDDAALQSDLDDLTRQLSDVETALMPTIVKIKNNIYGTNGGIYVSTNVHRNASSYRRTTPYFVKSGEKVVAYLASTRAYYVIAAYSSTTISAANFIAGVMGKTEYMLNRYEYTATQDCYVIFTTYATTAWNNICAFIYDEYTDGEKFLAIDSQRTNNSISSGQKIIPCMIRYETTINASGAISSKSNDVITNKIYNNGSNSFSVHSWGFSWLSINLYDASGAFSSRYEFTSSIIPADYDFFITVSTLSTIKYAIICGTVATGHSTDIKLNAFCGASPELKYVEPEKDYERANVESAAHRGWTYGVPENSLVSTAEAKRHYFKIVENDVRFTSDGVAVLLHDESINRVARNADGTVISGTVNIADITYEQALTYDFGVYAGSAYTGTKICTLEDQLKLCKKLGLKLWIEPKSANHATDIANLVKKCGMENYVAYIGFSSNILSQILEIVPNATVMLARSAISESYLNECIALKTSNNIVYAYLDYTNAITQSDIDDMVEAGINLGLYTVDNYSAILSLNPYATRVASTYYPADIVIAQETMDLS